jgi:hypothetical protein
MLQFLLFLKLTVQFIFFIVLQRKTKICQKIRRGNLIFANIYKGCFKNNNLCEDVGIQAENNGKGPND